jgi:predicted dehydrogenase
MLAQTETTEVAVTCEPSVEAVAATKDLFEERGLVSPPNEPDLERLLEQYRGRLDAAFIVTPHKFHFEQATACLVAGLDVLLEKPMVMNRGEAEALIATRNATGRLLVVGFTGSLSPNIRTAARMIQKGEIGELLTISATVWQNWKEATTGAWRQVPELAGGGFMFDTGAHMLNTVTDLAGENFSEVAAWLDARGTEVDILGAVMARLESGALVTMNACGEAIPSCTSLVKVFGSEGILRTDIWGERLEIQRRDETLFSRVETEPSMGAWQRFLTVRRGDLANPSPPEVGLRMAKLWDAIQDSASHHGQPKVVGV